MSSGLELDRPPRPTGTQDIVPADPSSWYPTPQKDRRWLQVLGKRVAVFVFVVVAAGAAWRVTHGAALPAPIAALVKSAQRMASGQAVNDADGVACFTGVDGEYITYDDAEGSANIVTSPAQVPAQYRSRARCIFLKPQQN